MNNSSLWQDAIRRLIQNRAAMIGGITILVLIMLAIFAPWIAPYSYSYQNLDIGASPPSAEHLLGTCLLYTSPSPRDRQKSRMPSSA